MGTIRRGRGRGCDDRERLRPPEWAPRSRAAWVTHAALVIFAGLLFVGCASPSKPKPVVAAGDDLRELPSGTRKVYSRDRSFSVGVQAHGRTMTGAGAAIGHDEAEFGIWLPGESIGIAVYVYNDDRLSIDDLVHSRRTTIRTGGEHRFESEKRFFLSTGQYRAASLSLYENQSSSTVDVAYVLVADTPSGSLELVGWTTDASSREALREVILSLRLEIAE